MQQTQQARAPQTQLFGEEAFGPSDGTTLRWLGMAGFSEDGQHLREDAAPDPPLGVCRRPRLRPVQRRPSLATGLVENPERIVVLAPGEPYELHRLM